MQNSKVPLCFGSGEPRKDLGHFCDLCTYSNPCASISQKFIPKDEVIARIEEIERKFRGEKHEHH